MSVINPRLPAVQDEGIAQGFAHTLNFAGAGVTAAVAAGVATITIPGGGGGSLTVIAFTVTCPPSTVDQLFQIIDASVGAGSKILLFVGHYTELDVNDPSDIYWNVVAVQAGSFFMRVASKGPEKVVGDYKFFYVIG